MIHHLFYQAIAYAVISYITAYIPLFQQIFQHRTDDPFIYFGFFQTFYRMSHIIDHFCSQLLQSNVLRDQWLHISQDFLKTLYILLCQFPYFIKNPVMGKNIFFIPKVFDFFQCFQCL